MKSLTPLRITTYELAVVRITGIEVIPVGAIVYYVCENPTYPGVLICSTNNEYIHGRHLLFVGDDNIEIVKE